MKKDTMLEKGYTAWLSAMLDIAKHYRLDYSEEHVKATVAWEMGAPADVILDEMAKKLGLGRVTRDFHPNDLDPMSVPFILTLDNGRLGVVTHLDASGQCAVQFTEDQGLETTLTSEQLAERAKSITLLRPLHSIPDARVDNYIRPYKKNWFWDLALKDWRRYSDIMLASMIANVLALAGMLFSMQVYDRVVPSQSVPTLWVLFGGVMLAITFEFVMRMVRVHISDVVGKRADLRISDRVFGRALRIKNSARSKSTGSFISQIRELESVRELITSTTLSALSDLPFFLLFTVILWMIGGPLVFVVLLALPLLLIPGILIQKPLAKLANEGMRESAVRNASLVEAVESLEDIKLMRAEQRFQNQWNHCNEVSAEISMRQRFLTSLLMTWTQEVQSIVYAVVLLVGCYLVMQGDMTTGALVGTTILASRTIAPLAQISGVLSRWQQAKVARKGLDELMQRPIDQENGQKMVHKAQIAGEYALSDAVFYYDEEAKAVNLAISRLNIKPGEKIAILGKNGAGKSTLLQVLAGMQQVQQGQVVLDNVNIKQIDPADLRRDVALHNQHARLFFGSVHENITMGRPQATDEEIHEALVISGALAFVQQKEDGLNFLIHEGGVGLSGGQRQALLLARNIITQPQVLLLDEPTAWLDEISEWNLISQLSTWGKDKTLIIATHRLALLQLVDRIIVMDNGRISLDGNKEDILNKHFRPKGQTAAATAKPAASKEAS
ncbi:type I secretion system permease/ATPase [Rahnella sp. Lac-M11]|uniref:Type I secretion system permease/ATPase n=1 Tax=Rahnella contaminans TaxID=2703882 RepID=A0A6M2B050_9GAMM|nr:MULTISPECIES: type I secretion system permease/ATPase [Rahnella]KAB8309361.1 type I secretion system permease/ATPase [Rouxiella chamberiensis]MBU9820235.1 type I secretion system permease/ATPase [Rahnella sp. BCC 1045]NGX86212.1 type I secretion system permease/ATPase [Rahnella contaminans]